LRIQVYYIGKDKKNHHEAAEKLYLKRLKNYASIELVALPPLKLSKSLSNSEIKAKEAALFNKQLEQMDKVYLLDERGRMYSSEKFASFVQKNLSSGYRKVAFVIGGAFGFSEEIKKQYPELLRLSDLTFSHHLARTVLLEQLYRAFTILNNEPYHNS